MVSEAERFLQEIAAEAESVERSESDLINQRDQLLAQVRFLCFSSQQR